MKKFLYILWVLPLFTLFACEEDLTPYDEDTCRLNFVYEPYTKSDTLIRRTFVYDVDTRVYDTVWLEVETMGFLFDEDRAVKLEQVNGDGEVPTAKSGVHYVAFDDPQVAGLSVVPAGQSKAKIPVILKRDVSLKNEEVMLKVRIGTNDFFQPGYPDYQLKTIMVSDILTQPKYWNFYTKYYFAGEYGFEKHKFMIRATADMGLKMNDDFFYSLVGDPNSVDMGLTDYWFGFFSKKLAEENAQRKAQGLGPLREAPEPGESEGKLVVFTQYVQ